MKEASKVHDFNKSEQLTISFDYDEVVLEFGKGGTDLLKSWNKHLLHVRTVLLASITL